MTTLSLNHSAEHSISPAIGPIPINAEVEKTKSFSMKIKQPLDGLTAAFDALNVQSMKIAVLGEAGSTQEIDSLSETLRNQDEKHREGLLEIQKILDDLLKNQIMEAMREQVEQEIKTQIDKIVKEQVEECLKDHIPQELQEELAMSKQELEELNRRLHNSESRRANGKLRSNKPHESLATIFMANGNISSTYPTDLKGLFSLNGDQVKILMKDYGLPEPSDSRDRNLNRLLQFCGVRYQLVRPTTDRKR